MRRARGAPTMCSYGPLDRRLRSNDRLIFMRAPVVAPRVHFPNSIFLIAIAATVGFMIKRTQLRLGQTIPDGQFRKACRHIMMKT